MNSTKFNEDSLGYVIAVAKSGSHSFSKNLQDEIKLIEDFGVEGDVHGGKTIKHRSRLFRMKEAHNQRQVHLIHSELFEELKGKGFKVLPGELGENITTQGLDLLSLPKDTILMIGDSTKIKITGLRNPCKQIDKFQKGLQKAVLEKSETGGLLRKTGVMGVVINGGVVQPNDSITIELPPQPYQSLEVV